MPLSRRGFLVLAPAALLYGCASVGNIKPADKAGGITVAELTTATITNAINATRKEHNAAALTYNYTLETAARTHSTLMASRDTISHTLGGTLRQRVNDAGYHDAVGENLARGYDTLEGAIAGWLASPGHRSTLLNTKFTEFGLAAARGPKGVYWTFIAGGPVANWIY